MGHAIRDSFLAREVGEAKNHSQSTEHMNHDEEDRKAHQISTVLNVDKIMAMRPSDLEKIELQVGLKRRPVWTSLPSTKLDTEQCSVRKHDQDFVSSSAKPKYSIISQQPLPQRVTRQISDQFSPIKLEDIHKLDMSLFHAFLIATGSCLGKEEESAKEQVESPMPIHSEEIDLEDDDMQMASILIEALLDDEEMEAQVRNDTPFFRHHPASTSYKVNA